jgi:competence protein ComEC
LEKTVQNIPFLRLTIAVVIGIIIGNNFVINAKPVLAILFGILIFLIALNRKYKYSYSLIFGQAIQFFFIFLGILVFQQFNKNPVLHEKGYFEAVILETPQEKPNSYKSVVQVNSVFISDSSKPSNELIIAYFAKNENVKNLKAGDIILFENQPQTITNNNNPYEFDYKKYLERKRIYRQVYLPEATWIQTNKTRFSLRCQAEQIREMLLNLYRSQAIDETELEILSALTLGYKRDLDPETKRVFSASGASHVLAVSGLHVGIVFWLISILFGFLQKQKTGRILFVIISISVLWFYAFITGLSPSVIRASTMFTIFVAGQNLNRKANIYNSLAASAFLLLLINPNNLFDVGFQLSYAAVFGIVFLQPKLEKLFHVKNKFIRFFWSLITVSIAAQIATFPITTYYFGQFPTYFWITNTFVIPAVMILIPAGILLLFVSKVQFISGLLATILNYIIKATYFLLSFIEQLPFAVFDVSVNHVQFVFTAATIISVFIYLKSYQFRYVKIILFFILVLSVSTLLNNINRFRNTELIVYNTAKNPGIHLIHGRENYIISEEKIKDEELNYFPAFATIRQMGLNPPVYLISTDTFTDENILLKNGFVFFEGKSLSFKKNTAELNKDQLPDFIINPVKIDFNQFHIEPATTVISTKRYIDKKNINLPQIHFTTVKGAFRKKW